MIFLAKIGLGLGLFFSSLWAGTLGVLHLAPQASKAPTTEQALQQASSTSQELGPYSLRDGKVWYVNDEELVGASPATFSFVGGNFFGKDATHVFYRATEIVGADAGSFAPVFDDKGNAPLYSKDRNHVYVSSPQSQVTSVMQSVDAATFVAFDADSPKSCGDNCSYDAEDKTHKYLQGQVVQEDTVDSILPSGFSWVEQPVESRVVSFQNGDTYGQGYGGAATTSGKEYSAIYTVTPPVFISSYDWSHFEGLENQITTTLTSQGYHREVAQKPGTDTYTFSKKESGREYVIEAQFSTWPWNDTQCPKDADMLDNCHRIVSEHYSVYMADPF